MLTTVDAFLPTRIAERRAAAIPKRCQSLISHCSFVAICAESEIWDGRFGWW